MAKICRLTPVLALLSIWILSPSICTAQRADPATTDTLGADGRIVYSSFRPAGWDVYHVEQPGAAPRRLTDDPALDYDAVLSPDGRWVVFTSERGGSPDLFVLDLEGDGPPRRLVESGAMEDQAALSPDGEWLAFVGTASGNAEVYLLPFDPDSTRGMGDAVNLTRHPGGDFRPGFSPDGRHVVFSSDRDATPTPHPRFPFAFQREGELYVTDRKGGEARRLTNSPGWDGSPVWAPDGSVVYFYSERDEGEGFRIWAVEPQGGDPRPVSPADVPALSPAVSPDGRVAFSTWANDSIGKHWHVASVAPGGEDVRVETKTGIDCLSPRFAASGRAMVCHGGKRFLPDPEDSFGFSGPLLVPGEPGVRRVGERTVSLQGVRHPFAAPPHPGGGRLVHATQGFELTPWLFGFGALVLLLLGVVVRGGVQAWRSRGTGQPSGGKAYGAAAGGGFLAFVGLLGAAAYTALLHGGRLWWLTLALGGASLAALVVLGLVVRRSRRSRREGQGTYPAWRYGVLVAATTCLALAYLTGLHSRLLDLPVRFHETSLVDGSQRVLGTFDAVERYTLRNRQIMGLRWSGDGASIVLTVGDFRSSPGSQADVWKVRPDGSSAVNLTPDSPGNDGHADVSADGRRIVFRSGRSGVFDLYMMDADGDRLRRLTESAAKENFPTFSPGGDEIAFASNRDGTFYGEERSFDIYTLGLGPEGATGAIRRITTGAGQDAHPRYSPDGEWLLYTSDRGGISDEEPLVQTLLFSPQMYGEIYAYRLRDGLTVRLTHDKWEDGVPFWIQGRKGGPAEEGGGAVARVGEPAGAPDLH